MYDQIKDCIWYISLLCSLLHIMDMHKPLNFKVIYKFLKSFIRIWTEKEDGPNQRI